MRKDTLPLLFTLMAIGTHASAASFDCALAHSTVERMVCTESRLSQLDEKLAATWTAFRNMPGNENAKKTMQLAWLKTRNACGDTQCLRRTYEARIAELRARIVDASPFTGFWRKEYPCDGATGMYEERCNRGGRDVFELAIRAKNGSICATHVATAQLGNRVDEDEDATPSLTGKSSGNTAALAYRGSRGGNGTATIHVDGDTLYWKITSKDDGASWMPDDASLRRVPAGQYDHLPNCTRR